MTVVEEEISSQPRVWREAVAALREQAGQGESDAFAASELPLGRSGRDDAVR